MSVFHVLAGCIWFGVIALVLLTLPVPSCVEAPINKARVKLYETFFTFNVCPCSSSIRIKFIDFMFVMYLVLAVSWLYTMEVSGASSSSGLTDRAIKNSSKFRKQRNFWMVAFGTVVYYALARFTALIAKYESQRVANASVVVSASDSAGASTSVDEQSKTKKTQ
eukprot:TRINITY_DN3543_c0_g1_i1.p1 TRINITY_DN3543_c0_g1~~TRINITY_DN3543_c0_g1_i1.p1  ORF type:complete len:165 (-),score=34.12 TRINITY_DN3543_c0_g1_i1:56-550(-)